MTKTLLIIPGLPRCATTSLVNLLQQHPLVFKSRVKEPHTLIPDEIRNVLFYYNNGIKMNISRGGINTIEEYIKNFGGFVENKVYIDASTLYSIHCDFFSELDLIRKKYDLNIKFIILSRDPYDRAVSYYKFLLSRKEECRTFMVALREEIQGHNKNWFIGGYIQGGSNIKIVSSVLNNYSMDSLIQINIDEVDLYDKSTIELIVNHLNLSSFNYTTNIYENKSENYSGAFASNFRYSLKRIRAICPTLFESFIFRKLFNFSMLCLSKFASKADIKVDVTRTEFQQIAKRWNGIK